jgi:hypothetical protein
MPSSITRTGTATLLALLLATAPAVARGTMDEPHSVRFTFEIGPSFDYPHHTESDPTGYDYFDARNGEHGIAVAIGFEPDGRILGPITAALMFGIESYPFGGRTRQVFDYGSSVPLLQMGVDAKTAFTLAEEMRIVIGPWRRKEGFIDLGVGWTWVHGDPRVDRAGGTGEVVQSYPGIKFSGLLFEAGAGLRTHHPASKDWVIGIRTRGYTDILNAARSYLSGETRDNNNTNGGHTAQLYLGLITARKP